MSCRRVIDIGANLIDPMFFGIYNGRKKHESDLSDVLIRAWNVGIDKIIITAGSLEEGKKALELTSMDSRLFSTVGCHPTRCNEFEKSGNPDKYLSDLQDLILEGGSKVVAIGECGLDYDRLHFCEKDVQLKYFERQLELCKELNKPLFLHCRKAEENLLTLLKKHKDGLAGGVVHSYTGPVDYALKFIDYGYYIGINGCSLKNEDNLNVVKQLPLEKILLETDCPWCDIRPTHASAKFVETNFPSSKKEKWIEGYLVKGRNEPCNIIQILEIISKLKEQEINIVSEQVYQNAVKLFFPSIYNL